MKETSLKYLQIHTDLEKVISELKPNLFNSEQGINLDRLNNKRKEMLPAWLFVEAVEQSPIAISITDKEANMLYANQSFSKITGYSLAELIGKNQAILSYKTTPREIYHDLWHTVSSKKTWRGQLVNRRKNGDPYIANLTVEPILGSNKKVTHYLGIHHDSTESYQADKKLYNQKMLIESVINASSVAMVVLDNNNRIVIDNQQYKTLISDMDHSEPVLLFLDLIAQDLGDIRHYLVARPQGFNNFEVRIDRGVEYNPLWFSCSGKLFNEQTTHPSNFFQDDDEQYLLLSLSNITKQKQLQDKIRLHSLEIMLAEEEQVSSIRETLLGTIHQVSQPLNQIQAAIQLMQQKNQHGALLDLLKQLESSCQQTVSTLEQCIPEIALTSIQLVNLNQIIHEVLLLNSRYFLENNIIVDWQPSTTLPKILATENKLRVIFKQLIDNSVTALKRCHDTNRSIKISTQAINDYVVIKISDTGPGIPLGKQSKVFQPFYTTAKMGEVQTGMGLVTAKELVSQMHGTIEIDPNYQQGCCFKLSFPVIKLDNTAGILNG